MQIMENRQKHYFRISSAQKFQRRISSIECESSKN